MGGAVPLILATYPGSRVSAGFKEIENSHSFERIRRMTIMRRLAAMTALVICLLGLIATMGCSSTGGSTPAATPATTPDKAPATPPASGGETDTVPATGK